MISDKDTKELLKELNRKLIFFIKQAHDPKNVEHKLYFEGIVEGLERSIKDIDFYNKRQSMKGFSSAVYGKKVAKEAKKNPKKAGKKMEQAFRNML